jgi:hypothetical protein
MPGLPGALPERHALTVLPSEPLISEKPVSGGGGRVIGRHGKRRVVGRDDKGLYSERYRTLASCSSTSLMPKDVGWRVK